MKKCKSGRASQKICNAFSFILDVHRTVCNSRSGSKNVDVEKVANVPSFGAGDEESGVPRKHKGGGQMPQ